MDSYDGTVDGLLLGTVALASPTNLAVCQVTGHVFVSSPVGNAIYMLDGRDSAMPGRHLRTIPIQNPSALYIDGSQGRLWATGFTSSIVLILDTSTGDATTILTVEGFPYAVAASSTLGFGYVLHLEEPNRITTIDIPSLSIADTRDINRAAV